MKSIIRMVGMTAIGLLLAGMSAFAATPEELGLTRVDVTAAVRGAGSGLFSVSGNITTHSSYPWAKLFDGSAQKVSDSEDKVFCTVDNVTNALASGGVEIVYEISSSYEAGKSIIVDGYSIMNGSGQTQAKNRLPSSWTFEGYDETTSSWNVLDSYQDFTNVVSMTYGSSEQFGATFHFLNSKSYRKYRLVITKQYWDTIGIDPSNPSYKYNVCALLLSEMQLFGYVTDGEPDIGGGKIDLTSFVRSTDESFKTIASNMKQNNSYPLSNLFDGVGSDLYFSASADVSSAYESGGGYIEYEFSDCFAHGSDIVLTGYSIMAPTNEIIRYPLYRMPCDWKFQGYDDSASAWVTFDEYSGFKGWEKFDFNSAGQYGFDFAFTNSVSYRKYRLLITRQCYDWYGIPASSGAGGMRLGEIRLWGYVGPGVAGSVGLDKPEFPFDYQGWKKLSDNIATYGQKFMFDFATSNSPCANITDNKGASYLFNGVETDRILCTFSEGELPFEIYFSIPDGEFLHEKDLVITNYTIQVADNWGSYANRVPLSWTFEAYGKERWIKLDSHNDFSGWVHDTANGNYLATFAIPDSGTFSATQYRLVVKSMVSGSQLQLSEIKLGGKWGVGIANEAPNRPGMAIIFR